MRAVTAAALAAFVCVAPLAARADAPPYPRAWAATQRYLNETTSPLNVFTVSMQVLSTGRYRIEVQNIAAASNFRYFAWVLPDGMTVERVLGTQSGDCGIFSGLISCIRELKHKGCGCGQRDLVVDFNAAVRLPIRAAGGYWIHLGLVTPYLDLPPTFSDLPICDLGEKSTPAHPCLS
jgi:hypothetical protein